MNNKGSIGLVCLLIVAVTLLLCQSLYTTLAADYRYTRTYVRQKQLVYAVSSALQALEEKHGQVATDVKSSLREQLPPHDLLELELSTYNHSGIKWLVSKGKLADMEITMVKAICALPTATSSLYNYGLVSASFNIDPTADLNATSTQNYKTYADGSFVAFNLTDYTRYAFVLPDSDGWKAGIGNNIFADRSGSKLELATRTVSGSGVFISYGDIVIKSGSHYPQRTQFITDGNVIVESNVKLDNTFILAGMAVKISQGSKITGKIFARSGIIIEKNTVIKDLPVADLTITTDKYLW